MLAAVEVEDFVQIHSKPFSSDRMHQTAEITVNFCSALFEPILGHFSPVWVGLSWITLPVLIMQLDEADFVSFQHREHRTMLDVTLLFCVRVSLFVSLILKCSFGYVR